MLDGIGIENILKINTDKVLQQEFYIRTQTISGNLNIFPISVHVIAPPPPRWSDKIITDVSMSVYRNLNGTLIDSPPFKY